MKKIVLYWLISSILDKNLTTLEEATKYYSAIFFFCQGGFSLPSLTLASPCSWPHGRTLGLASLARLDQIKFIQSKDKLFMSMITFTVCLWSKEMTMASLARVSLIVTDRKGASTTRQSVLCVTHQMSRKKRKDPVGSTVRVMNYKVIPVERIKKHHRFTLNWQRVWVGEILQYSASPDQISVNFELIKNIS